MTKSNHCLLVFIWFGMVWFGLFCPVFCDCNHSGWAFVEIIGWVDTVDCEGSIWNSVFHSCRFQTVKRWTLNNIRNGPLFRKHNVLFISFYFFFLLGIFSEHFRHNCYGLLHFNHFICRESFSFVWISDMDYMHQVDVTTDVVCLHIFESIFIIIHTVWTKTEWLVTSLWSG